MRNILVETRVQALQIKKIEGVARELILFTLPRLLKVHVAGYQQDVCGKTSTRALRRAVRTGKLISDPYFIAHVFNCMTKKIAAGQCF